MGRVRVFGTFSLAIVAGAMALAISPERRIPVAARRNDDGSIRSLEPALELRAAIRELIYATDSHRSRAEQTELQALYQRSAESPLWLTSALRPTHAGQDALTLVSRAADEGLDAADYQPERLGQRLNGLRAATRATATDAADFDVALSTCVLRYLHHLHNGRIDPRTIGFRLAVPPDRDDFPAILYDAIARDRVSEAATALRPSLFQYRALRGMLAQYRSLAADPMIALPPIVGTAVRSGDAYAGLRDLHGLLTALGDLPLDTPQPSASARYEGIVVDGVKRFQLRHGLEPDGILGKGTMAALCVPLKWRVRQIELALERLRWLPHLGDERLIALNIPMFRLWAWDQIPPNGAPLFGMDTIVGRALSTQTPVFSEEMREVIFRPYWNVPRSILRHEVLPAIARDADYLRRENMEIVQGPGDLAPAVQATRENIAKLGQGAFRVRQRPGPKNALGLIKFVFPNDDDVYMHGTPAQALFARSRRDFSHGCVRVEDPVRLAEWVLKDQPEWTIDRIRAAVSGSQTIRVKLVRPLRVVLFYTTAAVMPEDGTISFAEDIYGHDARLDQALTSRQSGS